MPKVPLSSLLLIGALEISFCIAFVEHSLWVVVGLTGSVHHVERYFNLYIFVIEISRYSL